MPVPLVIRLRSYLVSDNGSAAFAQLCKHEEALRLVSGPMELTRLLRSRTTSHDVRDAILRGLLAPTDKPSAAIATAVLTLTLLRSLRLTLLRIEKLHGDAECELALAVCECLPAAGAPAPSYVEYRRCVLERLRDRRRGTSGEPDCDASEIPAPGRHEVYGDILALARVRHIAEGLPHVDREIVLGVSVLGETHIEVSSRLGLTVGATWFRHTRALQTIAAQLVRERRREDRLRVGRSVPSVNTHPLSSFGGRETGPERKRSRCPTSGSRPTTSPTSTRPVAVPG